MKVISDLKESLLLRASDAGFDPATLFSQIDDFLLRSDGLDLDTHTWNQFKEKLDTFIQGNMTQDMVNFFQNLTNKDPPPSEAIMNEDETEEPMRLLISNGYEICVVDIKQPKDNPRSGVDYLPKIATLKLVEKQLPVSVGLFRLGSDAYIIGGQTLPTKFKAFVDPTDPDMYDAYRSMHLYHYAKGTSRDTYHLSIANNGTLVHSENKNLSLQTPKLWPVVAEIKGKLHMFDSFPSDFKCADPDWIFSHDVISCSNRSSLPMKSPLYFFIKSHLVLGDYIFAVTADHMHLLFDSIKSEWTSKKKTCGGSSSRGPIFFKHVWDILSDEGKAICVEEIKVGNVSYYLVLALLVELGPIRLLEYEYDDDDDLVFVVAYLVTSTGLIVGRQTLHGFFNGPVQPSFVITGAIIKGGGTDGKTMCVALTGRAIISGIKQASPLFFFSNTFTVELVNNSDFNIKRMLKARTKYEVAMDQELVRIDIKDRCVYKIDENDSGPAFSVSTEACFF